MSHDVIILGGGTAGSAAALALARAGASVALIEASAITAWRVGETLGAGARPELMRLGVWEMHLQGGHLPCHGTVSAWGSGQMVDQDHVFNPHGSAWQLDRPLFESMLLTEAAKAGAVVLRGHPAQITRNAGSGGTWEVLAGQSVLHAPWLIDATGRRAFAARHLGVQRQVLDDLVALHSLHAVSDPADRDSRTHLETEAEGWWYTSLLPGQRRVLSFQTDAALLPPEQAWRAPAWWAARFSHAPHLSELFRRHAITLAGSPALTSAHSGRLERFGGPGWLAIGDAAMSFDPVSGHGLLKALRSAALAAECLVHRPAQAVEECAAAHEELWSDYLNARRACYIAERRWPDAPFWQTRHRRQV